MDNNIANCSLNNRHYIYRFAHEKRYYILRLQNDLFGDWSLIKVYGGMHNNISHYRISSYEHYHEAVTEMKKIIKRRERHGYSLVVSE